MADLDAMLREQFRRRAPVERVFRVREYNLAKFFGNFIGFI